MTNFVKATGATIPAEFMRELEDTFGYKPPDRLEDYFRDGEIWKLAQHQVVQWIKAQCAVKGVMGSFDNRAST